MTQPIPADHPLPGDPRLDRTVSTRLSATNVVRLVDAKADWDAREEAVKGESDALNRLPRILDELAAIVVKESGKPAEDAILLVAALTMRWAEVKRGGHIHHYYTIRQDGQVITRCFAGDAEFVGEDRP